MITKTLRKEGWPVDWPASPTVAHPKIKQRLQSLISVDCPLSVQSPVVCHPAINPLCNQKRDPLDQGWVTPNSQAV